MIDTPHNTLHALAKRANGSRLAGHPVTPVLFTFLLTCIMALVLVTRSWFSNPIAWDGFGYWLYLPLVFVHQDLGMSDPRIVQEIFATYAPSDTFYQAHQAASGNWVIRYTPGLAVLHTPGFLVAHLVAKPLGFPADGLSLPYMVAVLFTSLVWLGIGLYTLLSILLHLVPGPIPFLVVALVLLGTNLFDQVIEHPLMTHLYTFALLSILLWSTMRLHLLPTSKHACIAGLALGLLILVRPTNALAALIPLLWPWGDGGLRTKFKDLFLHHLSALAVFCLMAALPVLMLFSYWKVYAGEWLYNSYQNPGEGLDLWQPHLFSFLFSYRKGWLLYTPVAIFGLAGLLLLVPPAWRRLQPPLGVFLIAFLYIVSTWTIWYYPGGFGQRAAVDVLPLVAVGMAFTFKRAAEAGLLWRVLLTTAIVALAVFMHFQLWQQRRHFRPPDRMTKAYYWATFWLTSPDPSLLHLLGPDRVSPPAAPDTAKYVMHAAWEPPWSNSPQRIVLNAALPFTPAFEQPFQRLTLADHAWVQVNAAILAKDTTGLRLSLVMHMDHNGMYGYRTLPVRFSTASDTSLYGKVDGYYLTPVARNSSDMLRIYLWHQGGPEVQVDRLSVRSWIPNME